MGEQKTQMPAARLEVGHRKAHTLRKARIQYAFEKGEERPRPFGATTYHCCNEICISMFLKRMNARIFLSLPRARGVDALTGERFGYIAGRLDAEGQMLCCVCAEPMREFKVFGLAAVTLTEAAERLGWTPKRVQESIADGQIKTFKADARNGFLAAADRKKNVTWVVQESILPLVAQRDAGASGYGRDAYEGYAD